MRVFIWFLLCAWNAYYVEWGFVHHQVGFMTMVSLFCTAFAAVQCFKAIKQPKEEEK